MRGKEISFSVGMGHGCNLVWVDTGDMPGTVSEWQSYVDLVQILWELGMLQAMFNPNMHGPDDECFMARMRDLVHTPSASFGSLKAILALYVRHRINDITTMVVKS